MIMLSSITLCYYLCLLLSRIKNVLILHYLFVIRVYIMYKFVIALCRKLYMEQAACVLN